MGRRFESCRGRQAHRTPPSGGTLPGAEIHRSGGCHAADRRRLTKVAEFCRRHQIRKLALFGFVLRDDFGPDRDVLVGLEPGHAPGLAFFAIERELSELIGRKVDLNTPRFSSPLFRDELIAQAESQYVAP